MRTVLITGGGGFTGRHIIQRLVESGRTVVSYNRNYATADDPRVIAAQGELFDIPRLMHVLQQHKVDAIVHTAAMSHPTLSLDVPVGTFAANVEGTLGVLEAARVTGVRRSSTSRRRPSTAAQMVLSTKGHRLHPQRPTPSRRSRPSGWAMSTKPATASRSLACASRKSMVLATRCPRCSATC